MGLFDAVGTLLGGAAGFMLGGPAGAAIGAGIGSGIDASNAASKASKAQVGAINDANSLQWNMYNTNRADLEPWRTAGTNALSSYAKQVNTPFQKSPGYQFAFDEGVSAMDRSAAASGRLNSGAHSKALTRYGKGMADQEYGNYLNRLASLSGVGQTATNSMVNLGQNTAANVGNNTINAGNARASGYMNSANAMTGGFQGAGNTLAMMYGNGLAFNSPNSAQTGMHGPTQGWSLW